MQSAEENLCQVEHIDDNISGSSSRLFPTRSRVPTFNSCTKCVGIPGIKKPINPVPTQFPGYGCMDSFTAGRGFDSQATWAIDVFGLF